MDHQPPHDLPEAPQEQQQPPASPDDQPLPDPDPEPFPDLDLESEEEPEPEDHISVGKDNTANLMAPFDAAETVEDFLKAQDVRVPLYASKILDASNQLLFEYDIDGVVLELESITAINRGLHYLFLPKKQRNMADHWKFFKKHFKLDGLSTSALTALTLCQGTAIAFLDGGYFLNLTVFPKDIQRPSVLLKLRHVYRGVALEALEEVADRFQKLLSMSSNEDIQRKTLQKQLLHDTAKFEVLEEDLAYILGLVEAAINDTNKDRGDIHISVSVIRLGQKQANTLDLDFLTTDKIRRTSLHVAMTMKTNDRDGNLAWSRNGMQRVMGHSANIWTNMGMHETVNIQTPLPGKPIDINRQFYRVLTSQGHPINFIQFYTPTPFVRKTVKRPHPVSGLITMLDLQHHSTRQEMQAEAARYLSSMRDMQRKMVGQLALRVEYVARIESAMSNSYVARDFFNAAEMAALLTEQALVVPFQGDEVVKILMMTVKYLCQVLMNLQASHAGKGGFEASWKAYQCEVAFEELVHGHPLLYADRNYSASLGTCTVRDWSLSHSRGFIGLEPFNNAAVGDNPPPIERWTRDPRLIHRVNRLFPLTNTLDTTPSLIGAQMLKVIIGDLFNTAILPLHLFTSVELEEGYRLTGSVTAESLSQQLATVYVFSFPHTFDRGRQLVSDAGHDVAACLLLGLGELGIKHFPLLRMKTGGRYNARVVPGHFLAVHPEGKDPPEQAQIATLVEEICTEMERWRITYARNLDHYRTFGMPWLPLVVKRLPAMEKEDRLKQLTFISCIALRQNNEFVDYGQFKELLAKCKYPQVFLQKKLILGHDLLEQVTAFRVWRIHHSIPVRVNKARQPKVPGQTRKEREEKEEEQDVPEEPPEPQEEQRSIPSASLVLAAGVKLRWTPWELDLVMRYHNLSHREAYNEYIKECQKVSMHVRTLRSFVEKRKEYRRKMAQKM